MQLAAVNEGRSQQTDGQEGKLRRTWSTRGSASAWRLPGLSVGGAAGRTHADGTWVGRCPLCHYLVRYLARYVGT